MISDKYHTWYDLVRESLLSYHLPVSRCADPEIVRIGNAVPELSALQDVIVKF